MKKLHLLLILLTPFITFGQMTKQTFKYASDSYYNVYKPTKQQPKGVIMFLPGQGEETNTIEDFNNPNIGPEKTELVKMLTDTTEYPYIFIVVQLHKISGDYPPSVIDAMFPLLDAYSNNGQLPIHVTGLSLGGIGVHLAIRRALIHNNGKPGYFTSAAAVCGRTNDTATVAYLGGLKLKMWHGTADTKVPIGPDRTLYKRLKPVMGNNIEIREYEGDGHNIWTKTYTQEYMPWVSQFDRPLQEVESVKNTAIVGGILYLETDKGKVYAGQLQRVK